MDNDKEIDLDSISFSSYMIATKTGALKEINSFINKRDDLAATNLKLYSKELKNIYNNLVNHLLIMVIKYNLESFIDMPISELYEKYSYEEIDKYKESIEFKIINECVLSLPDYFKEISKTMVVDSVISIKKNISHNLVLTKALSLAEKYLDNLSKSFNLSIKNFNFLAFSLIDGICSITYQSFNIDEYEEYLSIYYKKEDELKYLESEIYFKDSFEEKEKFEKAMLYAKSSKLKLELSDIKSNFHKKIIGFNILETFKEINNVNKKLDFKELKKMIKLEFDINVREKENSQQLKYLLWIIHLHANKKSDVLAFQDKFILDNMIIPWSEELSDLIEGDFDQSNFNVDEAINYIGRLRTKGEYSDTSQGRRYKTIALKKVFGLSIKVENLSITEYKYRDTLTTDYSDRMNSILKVLKKHGTKNNPAKEEKNGFIVYKNGNALDDSDIELFHYLIGELEEHGCETEIVFRKSDIVNNMGYTSLRGNKLDNLTSSLMNINAQSIAIVDTRKDKVGKRLGENNRNFKGTQLLRADFEGDGDEVLIKFTSPFSKYFRDQKQFGRLLNREMLNKYLYANTRVLKIARELSRMLFISNQKSKKSLETVGINYDTLIKKIDEWDKYSTHSNQRVYLQRLTNDISKAISYIENDIKYELIKPSPKTIKNGKIKIIK